MDMLILQISQQVLTSIAELFDTKYNKQRLCRADRAISEQMDLHVSELQLCKFIDWTC